MDIKAYLQKKKVAVDRSLEKLVPPAKTFPPAVHEAMRYSLFAGGKRVRPILAIASAEALGAPTAGLLPLAGSLELIHTYSLIHDDLPAMMTTISAAAGPPAKVAARPAAILAGDGLLNMAFEVCLTPALKRCPPSARYPGTLHRVRSLRHGGRSGG
jgi:geranylgeranyl diphosphate synthase type II